MMLERWEYHGSAHIVCGAGARERVGSLCGTGDYLLACSSRAYERFGLDRADWLPPSGCLTRFDIDAANPDLDWLDAEAGRFRGRPWAGLIAIGGGSVLDSAKVMSCLLADNGFSLDAHFRGGQPAPEGPCLPVMALPTTAGTGSEVTPFATVWDTAHEVKRSLLSAGMIPRHAVIDPELTRSMPRDITISSGLDALNQALESIWNRNATPLSMALAKEALVRSWRHLDGAVSEPGNMEHRSAMAHAALLSGMAISQSRTALCHAISYPVTLHFGVPHGLACGFTMAAVLAFNMPADDGRLAHAARLLGFESAPALQAAMVQRLRYLRVGSAVAQHVPGGLPALLDALAEFRDADRAGNNLRPASEGDVRRILSEAWNELAEDA